jgi:hypothetical protein
MDVICSTHESAEMCILKFCRKMFLHVTYKTGYGLDVWIYCTLYIVMDLINVLPGNGSVNTLPRRCNNTTTLVAVAAASAPKDWLGSRHVTCVFSEACPGCMYINEQSSEAEAVSWRSE